MGRDLLEKSPAARRLFERASAACGLDLAALCVSEGDDLLATERQQPAILAVELALYEILREAAGCAAECFAGHSLGEYAALAAAGVLPAPEAVRLVRLRGRFMQEAVPQGEGAMAAVVGADLDCERIETIARNHDLDVANYNSPEQVVLSGRTSDLERAVAALRADPAGRRWRCVRLRVSAPFHSRWMRPAADRFRGVLAESAGDWRIDNADRVIANVTGEPHVPERGALIEALVGQLVSPVRWLACMASVRARAPRIAEIGPSRTLAPFFRALAVDVEVVTDTAAAHALAAELG